MPSHILAEELIMRGAKRKPTIGQTITTFYHSITHLHFGAVGIVGDVEPLKLCANLRVLYLYENRLTSLKGVGSLERLTHLYAHENRVESLDDFEAPPSLEQLFLGANRLTTIEGLEGCTSLKELHVENQKPPLDAAGSAAADAKVDGGSGAPLSIARGSLLAIAPTLLKLNASGCRIDDDAIEPFVVLQRLRSLDVRGNCLSSVGRLQQLLVRLPELESARLAGNEQLTASPKFRERVIVATIGLAELDGRPIKPSERAFLVSLACRQAGGGGGPGAPRAPAPPLPVNERTMGVGRGGSRPASTAMLSNRAPQQLGVSIPSAQCYNLGQGHGVVGAQPAGLFEEHTLGASAALPAASRRPWSREPHAA